MTHLYYGRRIILCESEKDADAGVEMLARAHSTNVFVQAA